MRTFLRKFAVMLVLLGIAGRASAEEGVQWQPDVESAIRLAAQTHRLVILHFSAPWCDPCRRLEVNVFSQPGVRQALDARFVMVKLNVDTNQALAAKYEIKRIPTDVIVTPEGQFVAKLDCGDKQNPADYVAQIDHAAGGGQLAGARPHEPLPIANAPVSVASYTQMPSPQNYAAVPQAGQTPPSDGLEPRPTTQPPVAATPVAYANGPAMQQVGPYPTNPAPVAGPVDPRGSAAPIAYQPTAPVAYQPAAPAAVQPQIPPRGLDGFCPVTLTEQKKWTPGDPRFGALHRGCLYLFASPAEQQKFLANPDRYSPALSGNDPVFFDQGRTVPGQRKFGYYYEGRTYLFSCKATQDQFEHEPKRFAEHTLQAEMPLSTTIR